MCAFHSNQTAFRTFVVVTYAKRKDFLEDFTRFRELEKEEYRIERERERGGSFVSTEALAIILVDNCFFNRQFGRNYLGPQLASNRNNGCAGANDYKESLFS